MDIKEIIKQTRHKKEVPLRNISFVLTGLLAVVFIIDAITTKDYGTSSITYFMYGQVFAGVL